MEIATSFYEPGKVTFYNVILFIHITAAVVGFGVTFVYPMLLNGMKRIHPGGMARLHEIQQKIGARIITGGATGILLTGIYLAADGPHKFKDTFVSIGLVIIIVLLGLGGAFFSRQEKRLIELADHDIKASAGGEVAFSDEYERVFGRVSLVGALSSLLVLVAIFVMVIKPGI